MFPQMLEKQPEANKEKETNEEVGEGAEKKMIQKAGSNSPNLHQSFMMILNDPRYQKFIKPFNEEVGIYHEWRNRMVSWIYRTPALVEKGAHPEWPGYTGIGNKLDFKLKAQAYKSQCLIENTIFCFYPEPDDRNLTPKQLEARAKISSLYKDITDSKKPLDTRGITKFMRLFDQFFFFGAMANKGLFPRINCTMWEWTTERNKRRLDKIKATVHMGQALNAETQDDPPMPWGFNRDKYFRGFGPFCEIHIAGASFFENDPETINLRFFLETLVHEMVHAYIHIFMCHCNECFMDLPNTEGVTNHGPAFLKLLACIDQTLKSWDVDLRGLLVDMIVNEDGPPGVFDEMYVLCKRELSGHLAMLEAAALDEEEMKKEKMDRDSDETAVPARMDDAEIEEEPESVSMFNPAQGLCYVDEDTHVWLLGAFVGAAKVNPLKVEEAGRRVQGLIAREAATPNAKAKAWVKHHLRHWPRLGKMGEAKADQKGAVGN
ncbi:hypothetical protein F5Y09DRAFT_350441 [Xylaria sp. FL1042]|nr:hypothetical protein F5Y09DRAFT_350441 [Xylaria sp. FL1042]